MGCDLDYPGLGMSATARMQFLAAADTNTSGAATPPQPIGSKASPKDMPSASSPAALNLGAPSAPQIAQSGETAKLLLRLGQGLFLHRQPLGLKIPRQPFVDRYEFGLPI